VIDTLADRRRGGRCDCTRDSIFDMASALPIRHHLFSVEDFHEMGRAGILGPDSRVELIEGELIDMAPIGSRHAGVVAALSMHFSRRVGDAAVVWTQNPIAAPPRSEPQPDISLLRPREDGYQGSLPTANDILLLIEVAETTLQYDRTVKLPLYARHGVREVWIVNLPERMLEIYREPQGRAYRVGLQHAATDVASPLALPDAGVKLSELLAD
jgi:Uma2 family endonuclease